VYFLNLPVNKLLHFPNSHIYLETPHVLLYDDARLKRLWSSYPHKDTQYTEEVMSTH